MEFIAEGHFDRAGAFAYSREEGTRAASLPGQVSADLKVERLEELMEIQCTISRERLARLKGQTEHVLVEGTSAESELVRSGRHWGQAHDIDGVTYLTDGEAKPGEIVPVKITETHDHDLVGRILKHAARRN